MLAWGGMIISRPLRILISAGEASGDRLGADLVRALRNRVPALELRGMGGRHLLDEGLIPVAHARDISVVGLAEVLGGIRRILRARRRLLHLAEHWSPHIAILVDCPDFNHSLAKAFKQRGIYVIQLVAPQVWAWRPGRIHRFAAALDLLIVLFEFEVAIWRPTGIQVEWLGHPVRDRLVSLSRRRPSSHGGGRRKDAGEQNPPTIVLMPGSRPAEVKRILPHMIDTIARLRARLPDVACFVACAPGLDRRWVRKLCRGEDISIHAEEGAASLVHADAALIASGTATLEAALLACPAVIVYRLNRLSYWLAKLLLRRLRWIGLPNILLDKSVYKEYIQKINIPEVADALQEVMSSEAKRAALRADAEKLRLLLGAPGVMERLADVIVPLATRRLKNTEGADNADNISS